MIDLLRADYGLDPTRGGMVRTLGDHVDKRLATLGLREPAFIQRLREDEAERRRLLHVVTVRHSWFYRDPAQLEATIAGLRARHQAEPGRPLQLWVAGCAGGEEAWTLTMMLAANGLPGRVLATDLDALVLDDAAAGLYGAWSLRELPQELWRYLEPEGADRWRIGAELRARPPEFVAHNLCDPPPDRRFDMISCRNVLIYFEPSRALAVVDGLRGCLRPEGELVLGAGDLLFQIGDRGAGVPRLAETRPRPTSASVPATQPATVRPSERPARFASTRPIADRDPEQDPERDPGRDSGRDPRRRPEPRAPSPLAAAVTATVTPASTAGSTPSPEPDAAELDAAQAKLGAAGAAVEAGQYREALAPLAELVAGDPLLAEAHLWAGIAHYSLSEDQAAAEALRRARCLVPQLWPATLFAALTNERRGRWSAAQRCWTELERIIEAPDAPAIDGTNTLLAALPHWRSEALALARQRITKQPDAKPHD